MQGRFVIGWRHQKPIPDPPVLGRGWKNNPWQKRERTGTSFLYWLDWKSKLCNWNVTRWKATHSSLRVFIGKLSKCEPYIYKSCKIPYKPLNFCGLSSQRIQTLYFRWYFKSYNFAIFFLKILPILLKTLRFKYLSFSNKRKTPMLFSSPLTFLQWAITTLNACGNAGILSRNRDG